MSRSSRKSWTRPINPLNIKPPNFRRPKSAVSAYAEEPLHPQDDRRTASNHTPQGDSASARNGVRRLNGLGIGHPYEDNTGRLIQHHPGGCILGPDAVSV